MSYAHTKAGMMEVYRLPVTRNIEGYIKGRGDFYNLKNMLDDPEEQLRKSLLHPNPNQMYHGPPPEVLYRSQPRSQPHTNRPYKSQTCSRV